MHGRGRELGLSLWKPELPPCPLLWHLGFYKLKGLAYFSLLNLASRESSPNPNPSQPKIHGPLYFLQPTNRCGLMFTLTTNLAIWMAAVVDESVHQGSAHSNASHTRLLPDREFPLSPKAEAVRLWTGCFADF